jgi:hypothetical protein
MVTTADYDQDGKDELCLMIGVNSDGFNAPYVVLDDKDANFAELHKGEVGNTSMRLRIGNLVAGDFTGDGLPDTAFYGYTINGDGKNLLLLQTTLNNQFTPVFEWVVSANKHLSTGGHRIPRLAAGDVDGDRQADLYASNHLWTFNNSTNQQPRPEGRGMLFSSGG